MTTVADEVLDVEAAHILQVYKRLPLVLVRGAGSRVTDSEGREYIDLLSGIGVASLGHAHAGLARAIAAQAEELLHTSNLFFHPLQGQLAARLSGLSGLPRAFFCNSGTEAVEACLKFARRYWHTAGDPAPHRNRRPRALVSRAHLRLALGHFRCPVPDAVRAAGARRALRGAGRSGRTPPGGNFRDGRRHRRADTRGRRRLAAIRDDGGDA